ncbi:MAG: hypothetical protein OXL41_11430 [Nitrospinae bacterium]|nr:hypothetical protein [Nitrospinota bacterium]
MKEFSKVLGFELPRSVCLNFEYKVPVQCGRGPASQTDLMLISGEVCVAIEAKFTEPKYETVAQWLVKGKDIENRKKVLKGWLGLLSPELKETDVADLTYQLIHRAASACYPKAKSHHLVYQVFDVNSAQKEEYLCDLQILRGLVSPDRLSIHLVECSIRRTSLQKCLERRWDEGERFFHEPVLCGLKNGELIDVELKNTSTIK